MKSTTILNLKLLSSIGLLTLGLFASSLAQAAPRYVTQGKNDPVKISYLQHGVLKLQSRSAQTTLNIKNDLYGCLRTYDGSDPQSKPDTSDAISIRVLDEVVKGDKFFLLLQIGSPSNCNIQSQCGAAEETGVYWWQFNSALKQENYRHVLIDSCMQSIEFRDWEGKPRDEELKLEMRHGKLTLKYTQRDYTENKNDKSYSLNYDRSTPEQGLVINEMK